MPTNLIKLFREELLPPTCFYKKPGFIKRYSDCQSTKMTDVNAVGL